MKCQKIWMGMLALCFAGWGAAARGALEHATVLDREGDWEVVQTDAGSAKSLFLASKGSNVRTHLASVEIPAETVTNVYWDAFAGWDSQTGVAAGGMVTNVETIARPFEFHAFVNAGSVYWVDWEGGTPRLWTAPCGTPETKTLLATGAAGSPSESRAFGAEPWKRGAAWWEEEPAEAERMVFQDGTVSRLSPGAAVAPRKGGIRGAAKAYEAYEKDYGYWDSGRWFAPDFDWQSPFADRQTVDIPDGVGKLGTYVFYRCTRLESATIPDSVKSIGDGAFAACSNLKSVAIGNGVTSIGDGAFEGCSGLTSVAIPDSVTSIEYAAFSGCSGLTSVTIPESVTDIGWFAFSGCSGLTSVTIPDSVTSIGDQAFDSCASALYDTKSIPGVRLVDGWAVGNQSPSGDLDLTGIRGIAGGAFYNCSGLTSVTISDSVTSIGDGAFYDCSGLTSMTIPDSVTSIGDWAFSGCSGLTSVTIPDSVTSIGDQAFAGCSGLTNVTVGRGVTSIGYNAFASCWGLTSMTIPGSVTNIGFGAFWDCGSLETLYVPASWRGTDKLADADLPAGCTVVYSHLALLESGRSFTAAAASGQQLGVEADVSWTVQSSAPWLTARTAGGSGNGTIVYDVAANEGSEARSGTITVTGGGLARTFTVEQKGKETVEWKYTVSDGQATVTGAEPAVGDLVIPSMLGGCPVTGIGSRAFSDCSNLISVTLSAYITNIAYSYSWYTGIYKYNAFSGCSGLTDVHVAGDNPAFSSKDGVLFSKDGTKLLFCPAGKTGAYSIPVGVSQIGDGEIYQGHFRQMGGWLAFSGCTKLTNVAIPDSVRVIDDGAFEGCSGLTSVTIPDSVTSIGICAFGGCTGLTTISIGSGVESIGESAFWGCDSLSAVHLHDLAAWCNLSFSFPGDHPLSYAPHLFLDGEEVTDLVIPTDVTKIGRYAFEGCSGLTSVTIPDSVTNIGWYAFSGSGLKTLYVPASWKGTSMLDGAGVPEGCTVVYVSKQLDLETGSRTFSAAAASGQKLAVTATVSWTASSSATWLTVVAASGTGNGTMTYNVAANPSANSRTGTITVTGGGLSRTFTVTQNGASAKLELGATTQSFTAAGAMGQTLVVSANMSWTANSSAAWLTMETASGLGNGTISYSVAANAETNSRMGTITVSGGGLTRIFIVTQTGAEAKLELGATTQSFTADAASGQTLAVTANVSWTAQSSVSWLMLTTASGSGNGNIVYAMTANTGTGERMGVITVVGGGLTRLFLVSQSGRTEPQTSPIEVPRQWLEENAAAALEANGGDCEAAAKAFASNGLPVWKCYVAGLSTTEAEAAFKVKSFAIVDGDVQVEWEPDLNEDGTKTERRYVVEGKPSMADEWGEKTPESRFFRVKVRMPEP